MYKQEITGEEIQKASASELYKKLKSNEHGLSGVEAEERLVLYGKNEIIEHKINPLLKFLKSFWGPIPWMIEIAAIIGLTGE